MRVLLDENLPLGLKEDLATHEVVTIREEGWSGISDAELLKRAGGRFDVVITADRNIEFQQNVAAARVGIVVVIVPDTRLQSVREVVPRILAALDTVRPGSAIRTDRVS